MCRDGLRYPPKSLSKGPTLRNPYTQAMPQLTPNESEKSRPRLSPRAILVTPLRVTAFRAHVILEHSGRGAVAKSTRADVPMRFGVRRKGFQYCRRSRAGDATCRRLVVRAKSRLLSSDVYRASVSPVVNAGWSAIQRVGPLRAFSLLLSIQLPLGTCQRISHECIRADQVPHRH